MTDDSKMNRMFRYTREVMHTIGAYCTLWSRHKSACEVTIAIFGYDVWVSLGRLTLWNKADVTEHDNGENAALDPYGISSLSS